jgi:hypothetical protein
MLPAPDTRQESATLKLELLPGDTPPYSLANGVATLFPGTTFHLCADWTGMADRYYYQSVADVGWPDVPVNTTPRVKVTVPQTDPKTFHAADTVQANRIELFVTFGDNRYDTPRVLRVLFYYRVHSETLEQAVEHGWKPPVLKTVQPRGAGPGGDPGDDLATLFARPGEWPSTWPPIREDGRMPLLPEARDVSTLVLYARHGYERSGEPWRNPVDLEAAHAEVDRMVESGDFRGIAPEVACWSALTGRALTPPTYPSLQALLDREVDMFGGGGNAGPSGR